MRQILTAGFALLFCSPIFAQQRVDLFPNDYTKTGLFFSIEIPTEGSNTSYVVRECKGTVSERTCQTHPLIEIPYSYYLGTLNAAKDLHARGEWNDFLRSVCGWGGAVIGGLGGQAAFAYMGVSAGAGIMLLPIIVGGAAGAVLVAGVCTAITGSGNSDFYKQRVLVLNPGKPNQALGITLAKYSAEQLYTTFAKMYEDLHPPEPVPVGPDLHELFQP